MDFDIIQGIINALNLDSRITALIGAGADMRIDFENVPADTVFPFCVITKAGRGKHTYYLGAVNQDRDAYYGVIFIGRNDAATNKGDVVHLDRYAFEALTPNKVTATNLVTFLRDCDVPDTTASQFAQGSVQYFSAGSIYHALFQLS